MFVPLLVLVFWLGVYPQPFLSRVEPALHQTAQLTRDRNLLCRMAEAERTISRAGAP